MPSSSGFLPVLSAVDEYGIISDKVPVAQWIEHWSPEPGAQVQFLSGTFFVALLHRTALPALLCLLDLWNVCELRIPKMPACVRIGGE